MRTQRKHGAATHSSSHCVPGTYLGVVRLIRRSAAARHRVDNEKGRRTVSRATWQCLYLVISGAVFFLVAVFHLLRLLYDWPVVVGTWTVPLWLSYVGLPVSFAYCVWAGWLLFTDRKTPIDSSFSGGRDRARF